MNRIRGALVTATIIIGGTAAAASAQFTPWSTAQKIDEIGGKQLGGQHAVARRLPDPVT
jgi:hypothetical protein